MTATVRRSGRDQLDQVEVRLVLGPGQDQTPARRADAFEHGDEIAVTKAQAVVLLDGYPNPQSNFEPADKAAMALVAAPVAEKE